MRVSIYAVLLAAPFLHGCFNAPTNAAARASALRQSSTRNKETPVSRANFVSLKWQRSGGYAGLQTQVLVHNGTMSLHRGAPDNKKPAQIKTLNTTEFKAILKLLNDAKFTKIVGKYNNPNMMDGFSDVVTLRLQKPGDKPQVFVVDSYGDAAPKAFHDVTEGLRALQNKKFTDQKN